MQQRPSWGAGPSQDGPGSEPAEVPWGPEAFLAERQARLEHETALRSQAQQRAFRRRSRRRWRRIGLVTLSLGVALPAAIWFGALLLRPGSPAYAESRTSAAEHRPTAGRGHQGQPLGAPAPAEESSNFRYLLTLPDNAPVAWDPCRPIRYVVNDRTAPREGSRLLREAIREISDATGLRFVWESDVDEPPSMGRSGFDPGRYGDRWSPVLIAWSDAAEYPGLAGPVLGRAGPVTAFRPSDPSQLVYVSGELTLDGEALHQQLEDHAGGYEMVKALIVHELGHLVGLDHVEDEMQVMNRYTVHGVNGLGRGDRAGLHQLGLGQCAPDV